MKGYAVGTGKRNIWNYGLYKKNKDRLFIGYKDFIEMNYIINYV